MQSEGTFRRDLYCKDKEQLHINPSLKKMTTEKLYQRHQFLTASISYIRVSIGYSKHLNAVLTKLTAPS